jgi:O-antigen/teichoic acid export membrane protein
MRQSTRLIINSLSMFARMATTIGISLLITRLLLRELGEVDFGLVLVLGATGTMLQFVTSALGVTLQRQLTREIVRNDFEATRRAFTTGWILFLGLGAILWIIGVAATPVVMRILTIPPDRAYAAWWVYQVTLLNAVLVVMATPYHAILVAHQHLAVQSVTEVFTALTRLAAVMLLLIVPWDRMVSYVVLQLLGYALVRWSLNFYCLWRYQASRPMPGYFDRAQLKEIFGIAIWSVLSQLSSRLRMQGSAIVLNIFFGPSVNAGYGIASQIVGFATTLSYSIQQSALPAVVGAHAKGNRESVQRLALVAGKYIVLLLSFVLLPLAIEAPLALSLWLGKLPPYSVIFTRLSVFYPMLNLFAYGYSFANIAGGDIGWHTRRILVSSALTLLVPGIAFYFGAAPWWMPVAAIAGSLYMIFATVWGLGAQIGLEPSRWVHETLLPTLGSLIPAVAAAGAAHWLMPESVWRLIAVTGAYASVAAPLIWFIGLASWERQLFARFIGSAIGRLQRTALARRQP